MESQQKLLEAIRRAGEGNQGEVPSEPVVEIDPPEPPDPGSNTLDDRLEDCTFDYEMCSSLGVPIVGELHNRPITVLAEAVASVVNVEGPVHVEEVIRRIRTLWGLNRAGQRIQDALMRGINYAERCWIVRRRGDFLWSRGMEAAPVRRRTGDLSPEIELICDEEIAEAVKLVLRHQFDTFPDDLIVRVSRLLGFRATHDTTANGISRVIDNLIREGNLERRPNGMIHLVG